MTWTKTTIEQVLDNPLGKTDGLSHDLIIQKMMLALYKTGVFSHDRKHEFFVNVSKRLISRGHWSSERELTSTARALHKFVDVLTIISEVNRKKREQAREPIRVPEKVTRLDWSNENNILEIPKDDVSFSPAMFEDEDILEV